MHNQTFKQMAAASVTALALWGIAAPAPTPGFSRIVSELDMGGDYLEVVNAATFQSDIEAFLDLLQDIAVGSGELKGKDIKAIEKFRKFLIGTGLLSVRGCGSSIIAADAGAYRHRSFVLTEKGRNPVLDIFACSTRKANVENYLPSTTAAAISFSTDLNGIALFAADAMEQLKLEEAEFVRAFCTKQQGSPSFAESFGAGTLLALTLDAKQPIKVPGEKLLVPKPGLIVAQMVKNVQPWVMLKAAVTEMAESTDATCSTVADPAFPNVDRLVIHSDDLIQMGFTPAFAYDKQRGIIIIASSTDLLSSALAAGIKKQGRLLDGQEFAKVLPANGELAGLGYLSPKVLPMLTGLVKQIMQDNQLPLSPSLTKIVDAPPAFWYAGVFVRQADGLKTDALASFGACNTLRMLSQGDPVSSIGALGMVSGALFPAVANAQKSANAAAFSMRGRNLYVAIIQANVDREAAGMLPVWPQTKVGGNADAADIAGKAFNRGCDYFNTLFDMANSGDEEKWSPYVSVSLNVLSNNLRLGTKIKPENIDWCIAANVTDEMDDNLPVLISANFNPALLLPSWDGKTNADRVLPIGPASGAAKSLFGDEMVVIIRKGGAAQSFTARNLTYANIYGKTAFAAAAVPVVYLTPSGMAVPRGAVK